MHTTEAIVLKVYDSGEADTLVSLYTKNFGKMVVKAKGTKKVTTKQGNFLHNLGIIKPSFIIGKNGYILSGVSSVKNYPALNKDLFCSGYVLSFFSLCSDISYEAYKDDKMYNLLKSVLKSADNIAVQNKQKADLLWRQEKQWLTSLLAISGFSEQELNFEKHNTPKQLDNYFKNLLQTRFERQVDFFGNIVGPKTNYGTS